MNTTLLAEHRHNFVGGYCTAYLTEDENGSRYVHTITRFASGCHMHTEPRKLGKVRVDMRALRQLAESVPTY